MVEIKRIKLKTNDQVFNTVLDTCIWKGTISDIVLALFRTSEEEYYIYESGNRDFMREHGVFESMAQISTSVIISNGICIETVSTSKVGEILEILERCGCK